MGLASLLADAGIKASDEEEISHWISTGYPVLNHRISGSYYKGIPMARMGEIYGASGCGKSSLCLNIIADTQAQGGFGIWCDHEKAFDIQHAISQGVSEDPEKWLYLKPLTFEESFDKVKKVLYTLRGITVTKDGSIKKGKAPLPYDKPIVVVFDSLASMTPQANMATDAEDMGMNNHLMLAKTTSSNMPAMVSVCELTNAAFVFTNQIRQKPGVMFGDPTVTPGGNAPEFYMSWRLSMTRAINKSTKVATKGDFEGQTVTVKITKNRFRPPFDTCKYDTTLFENGKVKVEVAKGVLEELADIGLLEKTTDGNKGSFYTWKDEKVSEAKMIERIESGELKNIITMLPKTIKD